MNYADHESDYWGSYALAIEEMRKELESRVVLPGARRRQAPVSLISGKTGAMKCPPQLAGLIAPSAAILQDAMVNDAIDARAGNIPPAGAAHTPGDA